MGDRTKLRQSKLLQTSKFAGLADSHISRDETVLEATDVTVEVFDGNNMKSHFNIAVVLTTQQLLAFRGGGMLGGKAPMKVDLTTVTQAGVTRQGNVNVEFKDSSGWPGLWKLHVGDMGVADHWMRQILQAQEARMRPQASRGPSPAWKECRARLQSFCDALAPLADADMVGQPFGEGFGLEYATELVSQHFLNSADAREADTILVMDILSATGKQIVPDDLDDVMGSTEQAFRHYELPPAQFKPVINLAGAAKSFLGEFEEDGASMWELWKRRDDVAAEFLCWHAIARLRLATAQKLSPI
jgi:hypothetical protein